MKVKLLKRLREEAKERFYVTETGNVLSLVENKIRYYITHEKHEFKNDDNYTFFKNQLKFSCDRKRNAYIRRCCKEMRDSRCKEKIIY